MKTFPQGRPPTLTFCNKWFDWLMNWLIILHMNLPKIFSTTAEREKEFFSQDFGIIFHSFHYRIRRDWGMEEGGHYGVASTKGRVLSNSRIINLNCSPCSVRSTSICTFSRLKKKVAYNKTGFQTHNATIHLHDDCTKWSKKTKKGAIFNKSKIILQDLRKNDKLVGY